MGPHSEAASWGRLEVVKLLGEWVGYQPQPPGEERIGEPFHLPSSSLANWATK